MSLKDYSLNYYLINGTTNEKIRIPKSNVNSIVMKDYSVNEVMLIDTILAELLDCDSVTIFKSYMKDL